MGTFSRRSFTTKSSMKKFVSNIFLNKEINPSDVLFGRSQSELLFNKNNLSKTASLSSSNSISRTSIQTSLYSKIPSPVTNIKSPVKKVVLTNSSSEIWSIKSGKGKVQ